jgi:ABC-type lipoprotein export system ATPase subunit/ABC-type antimicrobial peptide transport system permease subunit
MLEVKGIKRIYPIKNNEPVYALDGIDLKFQKTGMVFILGKSGSGKTTLLNVIGGLDSFDEGDILIKGKSTETFKQSDFDSYRNTMVGFIFQEYNMLDELNVGDNIGLALQLKSEKKSEELIKNVLKEVDLEGYEKRMPNALSVGQKQRVAIARALIKQPKIIMADEPTAALDHQTSVQVFDTLKKLSKDHLVIVVSHDRDFAFKYADRIVEIKDGKVTDDLTITSEVLSQIESPFKIIDGNLVIQKGYQLKQKDIDVINEMLLTGKAIEKENKVNRSFNPTNESSLVLDESEYTPIKSKLPFKVSFFMGLRGLKTKKFRLILSIFLASLAFMMFAISDATSTYSELEATKLSIASRENKILGIEKETQTIYPDYTTRQKEDLTDQDYTDLTELYPDYPILKVYAHNHSRYDLYLHLKNPDDQDINDSYHTTQMSGYVYLNTDNSADAFGINLIHGTWAITNDDVVITKYIAETFLLLGYKDSSVNNAGEDINHISELIGKRLNNKIISGIVDTNLDEDRYGVLKKQEEAPNLLFNEFNDVINRGMHALAFIKPGALPLTHHDFSEHSYYLGNVAQGLYINEYKPISYLDSLDYYLKDGVTTDSMGIDDIIVSIEYVSFLIRRDLNNNVPEIKAIYEPLFLSTKPMFDLVYDNLYENTKLNLDYQAKYPDYASHTDDVVFQNIIASLFDEVYDSYNIYSDYYLDMLIRYLQLQQLETLYDFETVINDSYVYNIINQKRINYNLEHDTDLSYEAYVLTLHPLYPYDLFQEIMGQTYTDPYLGVISRYENYYHAQSIAYGYYLDELTPEFTVAYYDERDNLGNYNIVGFYYNYDAGSLVISKENPVYESNLVNTQTEYDYFIMSVKAHQDDLDQLILGHMDSTSPKKYVLYNDITFVIGMASDIIMMLNTLFFYVAIFFVVFAALLLFNYISAGINSRKTEIGILRALGARKIDVFKIFLMENLIIAMINTLIACTLSIVLVSYFSNMFRTEYGLLVTILYLKPRQFLLILLYSVSISVITTALPVFFIASKKPIDAIKNRK